MMNKRKIEKTYVALIALLIGIQPILELVWLNNGTIGEIAGFTIPTLIRFGLLGITGVLSFFVIQFNKRYIWLVIYAVIVSFYGILHHIFCHFSQLHFVHLQILCHHIFLLNILFHLYLLSPNYYRF